MNADIFKILSNLAPNINQQKPNNQNSNNNAPEQNKEEKQDNTQNTKTNMQSVYPNYDTQFNDSNPKFDEPCFSEQIKPQVKPNNNLFQNYTPEPDNFNTNQMQNNQQNSFNPAQQNTQPQQNAPSQKSSLLSSLLPLLLGGGGGGGGLDIASLLGGMSKNSDQNSSGAGANPLGSLLNNGDLLKSFLGKKAETKTSEKIDLSKLKKIDID